MAYIGKSPSSGIRNRFIYTATAGQTTFSGSDDHSRTLSYTDAEFMDVFLNGVKLDKSDYTATSGTSVVLDEGAAVDDILEVLAFDTFSVFSGEFSQDVTVGGSLTVDTDTLFVDSTNDRVGIGTTSPDAKMSIEQSGVGDFDSIILSRTTGNVGDAQSIVWQQNDLSNLKAASISGEITGASAGALAFNTASGGTLSERMRIDSSGNMDVYQGNKIRWRYAAGSTIRGSIEVDSADNIKFLNGSSETERMRVNTAGKLIKYGNLTSARIQPQTNGTGYLGESSFRWTQLYVTTATNVSSDSRLKTNIQDSDLGYDFIKSLRPVSYRVTNSGSDYVTDDNGDIVLDANGEETFAPVAGTRTHYGFIAQEVKTSLGENAGNISIWGLDDPDDPDSFQSLAYEELISPLTKALQEAIAKIETLETKVATLETENADFETRIAALEAN